MNIAGRPTRTIWLADDGITVEVIDQTKLPHVVEVRRLASLADAAEAIRTMVVRGAPLIGVTGAYGLAVALREDASDEGLARAVEVLAATRPTAVNLRWALDRMAARLRPVAPGERTAEAYRLAGEMADEDVATCRAIGEAGAALIRAAHERTGRRVETRRKKKAVLADRFEVASSRMRRGGDRLAFANLKSGGRRRLRSLLTAWVNPGSRQQAAFFRAWRERSRVGTPLLRRRCVWS